MTPRELPATLTPAQPVDIVWSLWRAWLELFGAPPSPKSIWLLGAQWALETGWGRACHCWNFGNVKHADGDGRCWCYFRCGEIIGGKQVWFDPPKPGACFRAFESIDEGAVEYLTFLAKHYAGAWPYVEAGDPSGFVHEIKRRGYFTAAEEPYRQAVVQIFGTFSRLPIDWSAMPRGAAELPTPATIDYLDLLELCRAEMAAERDAG